MILVTSAAVEDTIPDVVRARELGLPHLTRPQFLAQLLNAAQRSVAVGGTSGKSTVTGMIGWILHACHRQPTVMNGAVMKNFARPRAVRQRAGRRPRLFVSEVDESDGSIALFQLPLPAPTNFVLLAAVVGDVGERAAFAEQPQRALKRRTRATAFGPMPTSRRHRAARWRRLQPTSSASGPPRGRRRRPAARTSTPPRAPARARRRRGAAAQHRAARSVRASPAPPPGADQLARPSTSSSATSCS